MTLESDLMDFAQSRAYPWVTYQIIIGLSRGTAGGGGVLGWRLRGYGIDCHGLLAALYARAWTKVV
jgi:hypothetical protein